MFDPASDALYGLTGHGAWKCSDNGDGIGVLAAGAIRVDDLDDAIAIFSIMECHAFDDAFNRDLPISSIYGDEWNLTGAGHMPAF